MFASPGEAERIGRDIIDARLAACVNILRPCHSIYRRPWTKTPSSLDQDIRITHPVRPVGFTPEIPDARHRIIRA
ncbi:MAG: divalent cation tolerance protein CutA [Sphingomicrobium sp.]